MLGFDVYLSWSKSSALPDTETLVMLLKPRYTMSQLICELHLLW